MHHERKEVSADHEVLDHMIHVQEVIKGKIWVWSIVQGKGFSEKNRDRIFNIFWAYEFIEPSVPMREASGYPRSYG